MTSAILYLDASALVKLVVDEPETAALHQFLMDWPTRVVSAIALVEVGRVLFKIDAPREAHSRWQAILQRIAVLRIDDDVISRAQRIAPPTLRSLDAVHLATATSLRSDLGALVTYDKQLASAAVHAALRVESPT